MDSLQKAHQAYWRRNITVLLALLVVWAVPSLLMGIVYVEQLNQFTLGGFPLGFWFAQQGSIYVFVILIFVYVNWMNKLDKKYGVDE